LKNALTVKGGKTYINQFYSHIDVNLFYVHIHATIMGYKKIDKIRRNFLWHGHKKNTSDKHVNLVAWGTVTMPKKLGGLGVIDFATMNKALMTKKYMALVEQGI
jgi:hypothetical protein